MITALQASKLENVIKSGFLYKEGGKKKGFNDYKKRWFVLKGHSLMYYISQEVININFIIFIYYLTI